MATEKPRREYSGGIPMLVVGSLLLIFVVMITGFVLLDVVPWLSYAIFGALIIGGPFLVLAAGKRSGMR